MKEKTTMYTLASELNMSVTSISRAFNPNSKLRPDKREYILSAAEKIGYVPNNMASRLSRATISIGILIYGYMDVYDNEIIDGIESAYRELYGFKVIYDVHRMKNSESTMEEALGVLDGFLQKRYDGVLISKLPEKIVRGKINELSEAGIKVVIFDSDVPDCDRLFVSMNNISVATKIVSQLLRMFIKSSSRNIAVFYGCDQVELTSLFYKHARENGLNTPISEELIIDEGEVALNENMKRVGEVFERQLDINGVYVTNANCIPVCKYIEKNGLANKITLITSDIFDAMRPYIENGVIDASIYQNPFSQGYEAFKNLYYHLAEKKEIPELLLAQPQIIIRSNMSLF